MNQSARRPARLLLAVVLSASFLALPIVTDTTPIAAAAGWTCPVEDRDTRPNSGGQPVASFQVKGLDISHWNTVSIAAVARARIPFVYHKATQGTYMVDDKFEAQAAAAKTVGVRFGAYHFFDYRQDGKAQAVHFIKAVRARGGFDLRPVVDVECLGVLGKPDHARARDRVRAFVDEVRRQLGVKPIVYTSIYEWQTVTGGSSAFGDTLLWSAEWASTAPLKFPPGWRSWTLWQYGAQAVPGIRQALGGDAFNGSRAEFIELFGGSILPPPDGVVVVRRPR